MDDSLVCQCDAQVEEADCVLFCLFHCEGHGRPDGVENVGESLWRDSGASISGWSHLHMF